jgi:hypothetical protein
MSDQGKDGPSEQPQTKRTSKIIIIPPDEWQGQEPAPPFVVRTHSESRFVYWLIAVVVLAAALAGGLYMLSKKLEYDDARDYQPGQYASKTKSVCIKIPPFVSFCPEEQNDSSADARRSDNDLAAQQEMADWAFVMAAFTAAGLALSGIGITLIYATFEANHRAAVAANDANRPWVEITITDVLSFSIEPHFARVQFLVDIENMGRSPATNVMHRALLVAVPEGGQGSYNAITRIVKILNRFDAQHPERGTTIFPNVRREKLVFGANLGRSELDRIANGPGGKVQFWIAIGVRYKFGEKWCRTSHAYLLNFKNGIQALPASENIVFKAGEFRISEMAQDYAT